MITCVLTTPENPRVSVRDYTRKDGTKVSGYTRRYPGRPDKDSPYFGILSSIAILTFVGGGFLLSQHERRTNTDNKTKTTHSNPYIIVMDDHDKAAHNTGAKGISPIGFYDEIASMAKKLSIGTTSITENGMVLDLISFQNIRAVMQKYDMMNSAYITIHPMKDRKVLRYFSHGTNHDARKLQIFNSDKSRNYGHLAFNDFLTAIKAYLKNSQLLIINRDSFDLFSKIFDSQAFELLLSKSYVWDADQIVDCRVNKNLILGVGISPMNLFFSYSNSHSDFNRFDKSHDNISKFFATFHPEALHLIGIEPIDKSSLGFFKLPYYEAIQSILHKHYHKLGTFQTYEIYGLQTHQHELS